MLQLKLLWGFGCCRTPRHTMSGQSALPPERCSGKGFTSNRRKAIYSTGRAAKPLNLAAGKKNLSLIDSAEKELGRIKLLFHIINVDFSLHGTTAVLATIQCKQFYCYQVYRIKRSPTRAMLTISTLPYNFYLHSQNPAHRNSEF